MSHELGIYLENPTGNIYEIGVSNALSHKYHVKCADPIAKIMRIVAKFDAEFKRRDDFGAGFYEGDGKKMESIIAEHVQEIKRAPKFKVNIPEKVMSDVKYFDNLSLLHKSPIVLRQNNAENAAEPYTFFAVYDMKTIDNMCAGKEIYEMITPYMPRRLHLHLSQTKNQPDFDIVAELAIDETVKAAIDFGFKATKNAARLFMGTNKSDVKPNKLGLISQIIVIFESIGFVDVKSYNKFLSVLAKRDTIAHMISTKILLADDLNTKIVPLYNSSVVKKYDKKLMTSYFIGDCQLYDASGV